MVIEYEFSCVLDLDMHHQAVASKDRTSLFGDTIFTITEETGKILIEWFHFEPQPTPKAFPQGQIRPQATVNSNSFVH